MTLHDALEVHVELVGVGLNNTDDHLRNHRFLRVRRGWTLSPAFDVNPNPELRQTTIAGADSPADEAEGLTKFSRPRTDT
ncbi:HipA domain-containing protein [Cryobacterium sp. CG_9.6]|uniref:HipA domain-containing protein n=1 Tax=Cryobacterium sp. CG_9.6 TaxID=2760710 RepID=UPI002473F3F7|nr:HipA domain-containing protein [Cryobacterium sp. CG_9.6]MDH6238181.1 serine/threonine protein kinase HipA of HipAB toxin-antitoxin module [Cryobacterium sp. CG_9.6]